MTRQARRREAFNHELKAVNKEYVSVVVSRHGTFTVFNIPRKARRRIARVRAKKNDQETI
jgi:hypothetical protein